MTAGTGRGIRVRPEAALLLAASVVLAGCGESRPGPTRASSCGYVYDVLAPGRTFGLGGCSGSLPGDSSLTVRLTVGGSLHLSAMTDTGGRAVAALPASSDDRVLRRDGATGTYRALAAGTARLVSRTVVCNGPVVDGLPECTALRVVVVPR